MNEIKTSCASTDQQITIWESIDWNKCEAKVKKLQARIVKAQKDGRHNKVKALQWILTHSFYAKPKSVIRKTFFLFVMLLLFLQQKLNVMQYN